MQFNSFAEFINMGGYAFYVWLSYGVSAALIIYLLFTSFSRHKSLLKQIALRQKRELKLREAAKLHMEKNDLKYPNVQSINSQSINSQSAHNLEET